MAQVGTLTVDLIAQTASFNANISKAAANLNSNAARMNRSLAGVQSGLNKTAQAARVAAFALAGSALIEGVKASLDYAASLGEVSQQLGVTTRDLQVYRFIGSQVGAAQEDMDRGLQKLTLSLGKSAEGSRAQTDALAALGVSLRDVNGHVKTAGQAIPEIAQGLSKIPDAASRAALEVTLFGKSGQKLDTIMTGGKAGIDDYAKRAEALGLVLDDHLINQADQAADKMAALSQQLKVNFAAEVAANANAIFGMANALMTLTSAALTFIANYPRLSAALAGAAVGARIAGVPGAIGGAGLGFVGETLGSKANADANMDPAFRFQQMVRAKKDVDAARNARGRDRTGGLFVLRPSTTLGFSDNNADKELKRQRALYAQSQREFKGPGGPLAQPSPAPVGGVGGGGGGHRSLGRHSGGGRSSIDDATNKAKRNAEDFAEQLARLNDDLLSAKRDNITDVAALANIDRQLVGQEAMKLQSSIEADVASGKYNRAQGDQLEEKVWQVAAEKLLTINLQQAQHLADDALTVQRAANDNQRDLLDAQDRLAQTAADRRRIGLSLLALDKQEEKLRLEAVIASTKAAAVDQQIAQARLNQLDSIYGARAQSVTRDTAGPLEAYSQSLTMTPGQINEALQQIQVDGLKALNDGLVDAIVNFKSLGDVATQIIRQIAAELIQLAVSRYITAPLAAMLGGGSGGGGSGSGIGAGLSALSSIFGGGKAGGGPVNAGRAYWIGEHGPELFAPKVGGSIVPTPRAAALLGFAGGARGAGNDNMAPVHIHFNGAVSEREARRSGQQAAHAFRTEQARLLRMGG